MIVVVVIPLMVVETSLTMVFDELPPPLDPELPPADCDDEVDDVADVDEVAEADEVADVDDVDADEFAALDGVAVAAAAEEAIALIDMGTSPERSCRSGATIVRPVLSFNAANARSRRRKRQMRPPYLAANHHATRCMLFLLSRMACGLIAIGSRLL